MHKLLCVSNCAIRKRVYGLQDKILDTMHVSLLIWVLLLIVMQCIEVGQGSVSRIEEQTRYHYDCCIYMPFRSIRVQNVPNTCAWTATSIFMKLCTTALDVCDRVVKYELSNMLTCGSPSSYVLCVGYV